MLSEFLPKRKKSFEKSKEFGSSCQGSTYSFQHREGHIWLRLMGAMKEFLMESEWKKWKYLNPKIGSWNQLLVSVLWSFGTFSISSCSQGWLMQDKCCIITSKARFFQDGKTDVFLDKVYVWSENSIQLKLKALWGKQESQTMLILYGI